MCYFGFISCEIVQKTRCRFVLRFVSAMPILRVFYVWFNQSIKVSVERVGPKPFYSAFATLIFFDKSAFSNVSFYFVMNVFTSTQHSAVHFPIYDPIRR